MARVVAKSYLEVYLQHTPNHARAWFCLGQILDQEGKWSISQYKNAIQYSKDDPSAVLYFLGYTAELYWMKRHNAVGHMSKFVLEEFSERGMGRVTVSDLEDSTKLLFTKRKAHGFESLAMEKLDAREVEKKKAFREAGDEFRELIDRTEKIPAKWMLDYAECWYHSGRIEGAITQLNKALKQLPEWGHMLILKRQVLQNLTWIMKQRLKLMLWLLRMI